MRGIFLLPISLALAACEARHEPAAAPADPPASTAPALLPLASTPNYRAVFVGGHQSIDVCADPVTVEEIRGDDDPGSDVLKRGGCFVILTDSPPVRVDYFEDVHWRFSRDDGQTWLHGVNRVGRVRELLEPAAGPDDGQGPIYVYGYADARDLAPTTSPPEPRN